MCILIHVVNATLSKSGCGSVWLERHLREVEAASSNLVTPTKQHSEEYRRTKGFCGIFALKEYAFIVYFLSIPSS